MLKYEIILSLIKMMPDFFPNLNILLNGNFIRENPGVVAGSEMPLRKFSKIDRFQFYVTYLLFGQGGSELLNLRVVIVSGYCIFYTSGG